MAQLRDRVVQETLAKVNVDYVDRRTANWWNSRRAKDDVAVFCGWYWMRGLVEGGPFRSRSSALRDAYYRVVLGTEPPGLGRDGPEFPAASPERPAGSAGTAREAAWRAQQRQPGRVREKAHA